jgi:predicted dinucleotide-binding enzyme
MKIGVIGSGDVAKVLAKGFQKHGHNVMLGTREPQRLGEFASANAGLKVGSTMHTAQWAELLVLAVKGTAAVTVLSEIRQEVAGKIVIDATNPIADAPPVNGVLQYFTGPNESLMERLQTALPDARLVKALNSVGSLCMVNPQFEGGRPTMFIAGNDSAAKQTVTSLLDQFGWDTADMGTAMAARAIEPLCMLWCIPGFIRGDWNHAFGLFKPAQARPPVQ